MYFNLAKNIYFVVEEESLKKFESGISSSTKLKISLCQFENHWFFGFTHDSGDQSPESLVSSGIGRRQMTTSEVRIPLPYPTTVLVLVTSNTLIRKGPLLKLLGIITFHLYEFAINSTKKWSLIFLQNVICSSSYLQGNLLQRKSHQKRVLELPKLSLFTENFFFALESNTVFIRFLWL